MLEKPWIPHYDPGVKSALDYPKICIPDLLEEQARKNSQRIAVISREEKTTYGRINKLSRKIAKHLLDTGIKPGDRVGICLPNSIEFVISYFGILYAGGVVAAMNPMFPVMEIENQVTTSDVCAVITDIRNRDRFLGKAGYVLVTETMTIVLIDKNLGSAAIKGSQVVTKEKARIKFPEVEASEPAVIQFSGGTTGNPKAAVGTHQNIVANVTQFRNWLVTLEDGAETFLITIPLYHVYGQVLGLVLGVATGATMVFVEKPRDIDEILEKMQKYPVSYFPAVPTIFNMIVKHPDVKAGYYRFNTIKACISGSAPLSEQTRLAFEKLTGGNLVEGYGLSETPTATHCNPILGLKKAMSIGLPLPDVDCRLVDIDTGLDVDPETGGELLIRGPQVMKGYLNQPEESKHALKGGWLHTGDVAKMDEDGYFYIIGRIKDLIKVHGMQVWPSEVENIVNLHPKILECAAVGVADEKSGERVKICVVPVSGESISLDEIDDHCSGHIASYKVPTEIEIYTSLPRSAVGKVLRRELRK